jgi:UDP-GlcNAc:undecaprenyl-phosphate/decaprenyl-phosphate GlcNAc-1-phosphate transferase
MASFLVATSLLLALRPLASVVGLVDRPGGRKTHHGEVPVVGGISMFAGLLIAAIGGERIGHNGVMLLAVSGFMVVLGAIDDRFTLPARVRLFAHVSAGVALIYGTGLTVSSLGNLFGAGSLELGPLSLPFTVIATVALINAFNMLDGLDGLAASVGLVGFGSCLLLSGLMRSSASGLICGGMLGAILAFSLFNMPLYFNRAVRTFMGDAGSTLLGFVLAGVCLTLVQVEGPNLPPVLFLWILPIPIFELFTSTVRRIRKGLPPMQADAGHFHHVLLDAGLSVRAIALLYLLVSLACACLAILLYSEHVSESLMLLGFFAVFSVWLLGVYQAHRFVGYLPKWLRRIGPMTGH